jgi:CheY-like chemotaxis protein
MPGPQAAEEAIRMLVELLGKSVKGGGEVGGRPSWNKRKVLVCTHEKYRDKIASSLSENGYEVYVAQDTRQAVETMRNKQLDIVLLESEFDTSEQGAAFVVREINILRPPQRRRLFFALLSASFRTMDAHAAFLNNVNAVVNFTDLDLLPNILELSLRDHNELYKDFYAALNLPAL